MATVRNPDIDDVRVRPEQIRVTGIRPARLVGDVGRGDEARGRAFVRKRERSGLLPPPALEGHKPGVDGELRRQGKGCLRSDQAAETDGRIAAHAGPVSDHALIVARDFSHLTTRFKKVGVLVPVVVSRQNVNGVDTLVGEKVLAKGRSIEIRRVPQRLEGYKAAVPGKTRSGSRYQSRRPVNLESRQAQEPLVVGSDLSLGNPGKSGWQFCTDHLIVRRDATVRVWNNLSAI